MLYALWVDPYNDDRHDGYVTALMKDKSGWFVRPICGSWKFSDGRKDSLRADWDAPAGFRALMDERKVTAAKALKAARKTHNSDDIWNAEQDVKRLSYVAGALDLVVDYDFKNKDVPYDDQVKPEINHSFAEGVYKIWPRGKSWGPANSRQTMRNHGYHESNKVMFVPKAVLDTFLDFDLKQDAGIEVNHVPYSGPQCPGCV